MTTNQDCRDDEGLVAEAVDQLRVRLGEVAREVGAVALAPGADLGEALLLQLDYVQLKVGPETLQYIQLECLLNVIYGLLNQVVKDSWTILSNCIYRWRTSESKRIGPLSPSMLICKRCKNVEYVTGFFLEEEQKAIL